MPVSPRVFRCIIAGCASISLGTVGCAASSANEDTMAEIVRLRAEVRQSEERVVAMQAQQAELTQQLRLLSAIVGAMANEVQTRRVDAAPKTQVVAGNGPVAPIAPPEPPKPLQSPDLEF